MSTTMKMVSVAVMAMSADSDMMEACQYQSLEVTKPIHKQHKQVP